MKEKLFPKSQLIQTVCARVIILYHFMYFSETTSFPEQIFYFTYKKISKGNPPVDSQKNRKKRYIDSKLASVPNSVKEMLKVYL